MKKLTTAVLFVLTAILFVGCSFTGTTVNTSEVAELTNIIPKDIPMFVYIDLEKIDAEVILENALAKTDEVSFDELISNGLDCNGKLGFVLTEVNFDQTGDTPPTFAILVPSNRPQEFLEYIIELGQEKSQDDPAEIVEENGLTIVKDEDNDIYFKALDQGYVVMGFGDNIVDLINSIGNISEENSISNSPEFKESFSNIGMADPALYAFIGGAFYETLGEKFEEGMQEAGENFPSDFFKFPDIEYATFGGSVEGKNIIIKSYAKYGEDSENTMLAMYQADLPEDVEKLTNITGDIVGYLRIVMDFSKIQEILGSVFQEKEVDFSDFGMSEDEFFGMFRGDIQLIIGDINFAAPTLGGYIGITNKETAIKLMTIASAGLDLEGSGNHYTMTQGNNKIEIDILDDKIQLLVNAESFEGDDPSLSDVFSNAGIENADEYPYLFYFDLTKVTPLLNAFAPDVANKIDFIGSIASSSKMEENSATGYLIITGTGTNILEDIIGLFDE